jgi:type II secretory pathway pseudopilin PulG
MRRSAFMMLDVMISLLLLGTMMTMLALGLSAHRRTEQRLSDTRAAGNLAESALCDLQQGRPAKQVRIEKLTGGTMVNGYTWVRVTATVNHRSSVLTGLARNDAGELR